jgi:hypothetical protein
MSGWPGERTPMHEILSRGLDRVGHCGMPLKGTRDKVLVVMHPPTDAMATNSFLTILGTRREKWQIGMRDADPVPEEPVRNTLAAFVQASDQESPRFFLVPWTEYQLMLFWRIQHSASRRRVTISLEDVAAWEDRWDLLGAPGREGPDGRIIRRRDTP